MTLDIKICGLTSDDTLLAALNEGASHIGFIFFPKSPRHIEPAAAGMLRQHAVGRAKVVAVTVNADDAALDAIVKSLAPEILQLHGNETPERVRAVKQRYGLPVMKAFSISEAADLGQVEPFSNVADRLLFDAKPPKGSQLPGGNGVSFDWRLLAALDRDVDYMLSGGLNAANIGDALHLSNPPGIDISSGVERAPGIKDAALIAQFFKAVRSAQETSAT